MYRLLVLADSPEGISLNLHLTCIEAIEDCLLWLANCPVFLASSCFPIVVCCLLSLPVPAQFEHYAEFQEIFENISVSVKCELIRQFLSQENAFTNANELELYIDYALTASSLHSIDNIACGNYIPPFVLEGNTEFFQREVFPGKVEQRPIDQTCLTFVSQETENVLFRAYYFILANKAPSLRHACSSFRLYMDQIQRRDPTDGISIILLIKRSIAILEVINKFMERVSMITPGVYMNEFEARDLEAVRQAISLAPQTWAIYLLTRLNENSQVITFLHDQDLLNALNMQWWFYHPTIVPGTVTEANAAVANREQLFFAKLLTGIKHARMMILHSSHQYQLEMIPSLDIIQNYSAPVDESTQHMIDCCRLLLDEDLAYTKYLPTIIAMHSFMKDKFDYFFVNEEEVRTTLVVDALNRLPVHDQLIGKDLFKQFLATWRILKDFYQVFYVCPNELRGGDANGHHGNGNDVRTEIIDLTPENTYVSFLVEIAGTTEHESFTSRMIEKVLVYKLDQALSSPCIESLANQTNLEGLNPVQLVFDNPKHLKKAKLSSIGYQSNSILTSNILTGACSNPRYKRKIENYLSATVSWEVESEPPSIPDLSPLNATSTNLQDYMQCERDRLAAATQLEYAMINESTPVHGRKFIICPNCNIIFEKVDRCASVICAWSYHAEHRSSATNPGCGHAFNQANQLVQRPGNGIPVHPYFYELRPPIQLPAHMTNTSVTDIPDIPSPVVRCKVNWKALLQELLLNELHKKASFDLKNDNFFQPLQYLTPTVLAPPQVGKVNASNSHEKKEKTTIAYDEKQVTRGNLIQNLSSFTSYNVYVRLLIISEHIQALLHEYITSICSNEPKLQELDIINSLTSQLIQITPGQKNLMDNYLFNRDELVIHDITYQFYSFCEFFLRKSYEIIEEYHPFHDISKGLDLSRDGLQGLVKIIESKEGCLLSFYIDQYDQLLSSSFSSSKVNGTEDRALNDENNDMSDGFIGRSAASSLVCISGDFKRIIKRLTLFQIPLIAQFLANQGISGSNEISHSTNPLLPSMILFDEHFQNLLQNQLSSITFNNFALIRKELLELSSIADIMSDINELKLLTSELQKYSEEFLDFYEFTSFGTYFEENQNSLSLMIQQCSKESLLYRIMIGSEGSLLQLKHGNVLLKYLRKLISELEYENLKFLQQQWLKKQQQKSDQKGEAKQQQSRHEFKGEDVEDNNNHRFHYYSETIPKAWEKSQLPSLFEDVTMQQRSSELISPEVLMSSPSLEVDFEDLDEEESIDNDDPWRKVSSVSDRFRQRMKGKKDSSDEDDSPHSEEEGFIRIEVEDEDEDEIEILPTIVSDERISEITSTVSEKIVEERKSPPPSLPSAILLLQTERVEEAEKVSENNEAIRNRKIWSFISASGENGTCYCWNCLDIVNATPYNDITDNDVAPIIHNHEEEEENTEKVYQCPQCRLLNCLNCYEKEYDDIRRQMIDEYGVEDESSLNYIEDQDYLDLHDSSDLPIIAKRRFLTVCQIPDVPQTAGKQRDITKPDVWKTARASILKALLAWKKVNTANEGGAMNSPLLEKKREEFYQFIEEKGMIQPEDIRYLDENEFLFFTSCFKKVQMRQIIDSCVI